MPKKQVNFKLPPDLIEALDAKALQENTNRTDLVIQGIRHILGFSNVQNHRVDDSIHKRIEALENRLYQIEIRHVDDSVDSQCIEEDIYNRLHVLIEQLNERLITLEKKQTEPIGEPEHQIPPEAISSGDKSLQLTLTELAKRLGVDRSNLAKIRKNKTAEELAEYTKKRDPEELGWQFNQAEEVFRSI